MERFGEATTVQELLDFILTIPAGLRTLPISFIENDREHEGPFSLTAFSVYETEGCLEQGFRIEKESSSDS